MDLTEVSHGCHPARCGKQSMDLRRFFHRLPGRQPKTMKTKDLNPLAQTLVQSGKTPIPWPSEGLSPQGFPQDLWKTPCYASFTMPRERILLIEDEPDIAEVLQYNLEKEGFTVETARRGDSGLDSIRRDAPDLILLD